LSIAAWLFLTVPPRIENNNSRDFYYRDLIGASKYFGKFNEARELARISLKRPRKSPRAGVRSAAISTNG
jgi:hypothetical protein